MKQNHLWELLQNADSYIEEIKEKELDLKNANEKLSKFEGTRCKTCGQKIKIK